MTMCMTTSVEERVIGTTIVPPTPSIAKAIKSFKLEKIVTENDVLNGAELCVNVFFIEEDKKSNKISLFRRMNLQKLLRKHSYDLLNRFFNRPKDDTMIKAVCERNGEMVAYAEIFVAQLESGIFRDYMTRGPATQRLIDVDGRIFMPKIANLAVTKSYRQKGIGKQLVLECMKQAKEWGFEQVVLTVDMDNAEARSFYKRLGFEEMITDMSEQLYDLNSGPWLSTVRAPKVWLRKVMSDDDSAISTEEVCNVDEVTGATSGDGCEDGVLSGVSTA